jgi:hypothetical protein
VFSFVAERLTHTDSVQDPLQCRTSYAALKSGRINTIHGDGAAIWVILIMSVTFNQTITMGFVLSILYFVTSYLTPPVLFGPLAVYRIEFILAIPIFIISILKLKGSIILKTPQSLALIGLAFAGSLSVLFGMHWVMGAVQAFPSVPPMRICLLPCVPALQLEEEVAGRCAYAAVCLLVCDCARVHRSALWRSEFQRPSPARGHGRLQSEYWDSTLYLLAMRNDAGEYFYRLRGLGLINDPNDFGQVDNLSDSAAVHLLATKKMLRNIVFVVLPVCALLFGMYLTHSRGALLALMAIMIVAARRRTGTLPALLIAGGVFVAAMSLNFTGGRDISASAGSDRTALWSAGMQMLKSHPLFGVGLGSFTDNCDGCGLTAHNSLVICAAELGLFGLFFWCLFLLSSVRDALQLLRRQR